MKGPTLCPHHHGSVFNGARRVHVRCSGCRSSKWCDTDQRGHGQTWGGRPPRGGRFLARPVAHRTSYIMPPTADLLTTIRGSGLGRTPMATSRESLSSTALWIIADMLPLQNHEEPHSYCTRATFQYPTTAHRNPDIYHSKDRGASALVESTCPGRFSNFDFLFGGTSEPGPDR